MLAPAHGLEGLTRLSPGEHLVHHRVDAVQLDGPAHGFYHVARAHRMALQLCRIADQRGRVERLARAGADPDDGDMPADPDRAHALLDRAAAADLHDAVGASALGDVP